jgi:hypothetical protein
MYIIVEFLNGPSGSINFGPIRDHGSDRDQICVHLVSYHGPVQR